MCERERNYSKEVIKDNLIRGVADPKILADLLGDAKTDRSLEEVVSFIAQKEQGKATRSAIGDCTAHIRTDLKKAGHSNSSNPRTTTPQSKCWACGNQIHAPKNDKATRAKKCPAWSSTCTRCNVKGHFTRNCSKCATCGMWGHRDDKSYFCKKKSTLYMEDESFAEQLTTISEVPECLGAVDHHIFEDGRWIQRPSKPHPMVTATLTAVPEDHAEFDHPIDPSQTFRNVTVLMVADSGCQSCILPMETVLSMGHTEDSILPVSLMMKGAISENLEVTGGIVAIIRIGDESGEPKMTRQLIYVSRKIEKAFLCREAMVQLGIIPPDFPKVPPSLSEACLSGEDKCSCPRRCPHPPPMPKYLPEGLRPVEEDVPKLRSWLLQYYSSTTFNTCEHQKLPMMKGPPLKLHINPDAKPVAVHKPATVPVHWQEKVKADLERDCRLGVLEKVSPNTPVSWCSRMVVTAKSDGSPRRTVDLQPLNRSAVRQTHHTQSPFHLAEQIPQRTWKTVSDAWNGYHSVPLSEEDRHYTTFITPWGRYRYLVSPQGFLASGDGYTQRFDAVIAAFNDKVKCVDDTCMWSDSIEAAFFQACKWLDLLAQNGVTLNPQKFQFCQKEVEFAGLTISWENIMPSKKFLNSILNFPTPKDLTGARAWFGLVNQGSYAFSMAKEMRPFRHLLKPTNQFIWTKELDDLFHKSKETIVDIIKGGVRLFDLHRTTCLLTDWSVDGIGYMLKQKYCTCQSFVPTCCPDGWKLTLIGSRFTSPAESSYAPVEGEALAVVYGLQQTKYYTLGCPDLHVATDHKPLLGILGDKCLNDIPNRRLLNLKEKTLEFSFTIHHVSGKNNKGPDAVSRYPSSTLSPFENEEDSSITVQAISTLHTVSNMITWDAVKDHTAEDPTMQELTNAIHKGFDSVKNPSIKAYHRYAASMYTLDGVIMLGQKIVIPASLRPQILAALHSAHQGVGVMCQRASDTVFWPGITVDITRTKEECIHCHRIAKSNPSEPPEDITLPCYPFQMICADYFQFENKIYLVIVDRYSNWPIVIRGAGKAEDLVKELRDVFVTFGVPEELTSDGGPQFSAGFTQDFLNSWGVKHRVSSVGNPHANCRAEVAVKTVKRMLMANTSPSGSLNVDSFQKAMLIYRNSIDPETKTSPSGIIFGRPTRDPIPTPLGRYCPHSTWQETTVNRELALSKRHVREKEKWHQNTKSLPQLKTGDSVYLQNLSGNHPLRWERTGTVVECKPHHQYVVKVDGSGRTTLRNRRHLRKFTPFVSADHKFQSYSSHPVEETETSPVQPTVEAESLPAIPSPEVEDLPQPTTPASQPEESQVPANTDPLVDVIPSETINSPTPAETERTSGNKLPLALRRLLPHNKAGRREN